MDNPETLSTLSTQDIGQINIRENLVPMDCPLLIVHSVFSNVYLSYVLCTHCWQCLWIVHSWLSPRFSLTFICPLSCVFSAASVSALFILHCSLGFLYCLFVLCLVYSMLTGPLDCPFLIVPSVFSNIYLSSVLCIQCRQVSLHTQGTGQVDVRENRGGDQEWIIQRYCQHWVHKTQDK
jgi:hypothetical protein